MIKRTFIEKCNTIFKDSEENFGLNPIGMLNYGKDVSRCLLYFEIDVKDFKEGGKHYLKLTNCASLDSNTISENVFNPGDSEPKERACSFDLIVVRIQQDWDAGNGFDKGSDFWLVGKSSVSTKGSNWYQAKNGKAWNKVDDSGNTIFESGETVAEEGVYNFINESGETNNLFNNEYNKFLNGEDSIIIAKQHFDRGNESINLDITKFIEDVLTGKCENHGICLMFAPDLEASETKYSQYYSFFTNNTNTFFHPIVESRYEDTIKDDRYCAYIGKANRLYFYAVLGDSNTDLDTCPTCTVNGAEMDVFRAKTGVYYAEVKLNKENAEDNEIIYDTWSNLIYDGEELEDVEMEFVAHKKESYFKLGEAVNKVSNMIPILAGINDNEKIYQGDERTIKVTFKIPYSSDYELVSDAWYRLYVKNGKREIDVIDWDDIETIGKENSFNIRTAELIPNDYYIDIKAKIGNNIRIFKNKLNFTIVDNVTELKK